VAAGSSIKAKLLAGLSLLALGAATLLLAGAADAADAPSAHALDRTVLPIGPGPFRGVMAETPGQSQPSWPIMPQAPAGAPNVLLVMTDDVGFGASSTFGGPIPTPNLDRLAAMGLRYNEFHTTAVCSPSRAALLTGRNHHAVGAGELADVPEGFPGYDGMIPRSAATIGRILGGNGYSTAFIGKDHNIPPWETSAAGPFDQWPTGLGFDYFFGFVGGDVDQWSPRLFRGTTQVDDANDKGASPLDARLTDDALRWIHNQKAAAPDKPFFLYFAPGAGHAPHQAPASWIARFHGKFDQGWDKVREETFERQKALGVVPPGTRITARPSQIPAWDSLSPEMKRVNARYMEVYAAQVSYFDAQFGRLLDELQRMGQLDNTLIIFIQGDNGATAQNGPRPSENEIGDIGNRVQETDAQLAARIDLAGGPDTYECYSAGWAYALNAPFPWFKHIASHLGGTRNGMVVAWPAKIKDAGQIRTAFAHLNDILPTVLEATHIPAPLKVDGVEQQRLDGVSLTPTFSNPAADNHHTQYFELSGNRAIYHDGWMASTTPVRMPWERGAGPGSDTVPQWHELYDLRHDFAQADNLAAAQPEKLKQMVALWDSEARANNVYPIDARPNGARAMGAQAVQLNRGRMEFNYWSQDVSVAQAAAPSFAGRSFTVSATINIPKSRTTGVLLANGSWFGGWAFYLKDGRPVAIEAASQVPGDQFRIAAPERLKPGKSVVTYEFTSRGGVYAGGEMVISIDGKRVAAGPIARTIASTAGIGETLDIGRDTGVPVSRDYGPGAFPGVIDEVRVTLAPRQPGRRDPMPPD
jgi:arylsulfatase